VQPELAGHVGGEAEAHALFEGGDEGYYPDPERVRREFVSGFGSGCKSSAHASFVLSQWLFPF
jgi:hypothetical protein